MSPAISSEASPRSPQAVATPCSPTTSSAASPHTSEAVVTRSRSRASKSKNSCRECGPICSGLCPTALVVSLSPPGDMHAEREEAVKPEADDECMDDDEEEPLVDDDDDNVEGDSDETTDPFKCTRRNARCTNCNKRTSRWPGTLCYPCGQQWRETGMPANAKKCTHCSNADTCRWLRGPAGVQTLCNACGKRWLKTGTLAYMRSSKRGTGTTNSNHALEPNPTPTPKREIHSVTSPQCTHCGTKNSRIWRSGPAGRRTLCDECGIKWKRGGTVLVGSSHSHVSNGKKEEDMPVDDDDVEDMHEDEDYDNNKVKETRKRKLPPTHDPRYPQLAVNDDDEVYIDGQEDSSDDDDEEDAVEPEDCEIMTAHHPRSGKPNAPSVNAGPSRKVEKPIKQKVKQAKVLLEELDHMKKASDLMSSLLQSPNPNLERLKALNKYIACGFDTLCTEARRTFSN